MLVSSQMSCTTGVCWSWYHVLLVSWLSLSTKPCISTFLSKTPQFCRAISTEFQTNRFGFKFGLVVLRLIIGIDRDIIGLLSVSCDHHSDSSSISHGRKIQVDCFNILWWKTIYIYRYKTCFKRARRINTATTWTTFFSPSKILRFFL